jgi:hypothetical protein
LLYNMKLTTIILQVKRVKDDSNWYDQVFPIM